MSQPKPFEGPDAERLVEKIRRELGDDARILRGETVRTGGVFGFFAKERYRLYAAPGDTAPGDTAPGDTAPGDTDPAPATPAPATLPADTVPTVGEAAAPAPTPAPGTTPAAAPIDVFAALADEMAIHDELPPASVPLAAPPAVRPRAATTAPAQLVRRPGTLRTSGLRGAVGPATGRFVGTGGAAAGENDFGSVLQEVTRLLASTEDAAPAPVTTTTHATTTTTTTTDRSPACTSSPAHPATTGDLHLALRSTGLDAADAAATAALVADGADLSLALTELFARLAPPAPDLLPGPGRPVVVVGARTHARRLAASLAARSGHPAGAGDEAGAPPIVTVEVPVGARPAAQRTRAVLDLRPATVVGVIDAGTKAEDVAAWAASIGGLDALSLVNVESTLSPAAVLALGLPVASLDDRPATPARWAVTVMDLVGAGR